jgi:hypothetical protein
MNFKNLGAALLLLLSVGAVLLAAPGVVAADEAANETVTIENETEDLEVEIDWTSGAGDNNVTGDINVKDSDGMVVAQTTMDAVNNDTTNHTFSVTDWENGDYTVTVNATDENGTVASEYVADVWVTVSPTSGIAGGFLGGFSDAGLAVGAVLLIGGFVAVRED